MNKKEIALFFFDHELRKGRTIVIVDYGNVEKWKNTLKWDVGIRELAGVIRHFSEGKKYLRRFYYGSDYGKSEKTKDLVLWSQKVLETARNNRFEIITKRVKYIHDRNNTFGFNKKCDLDVEMAVDLIRQRDEYDVIVLFSGDGDLIHAIRYLKDVYGKKCYVFGARNHIGREVFDAVNDGYVQNIFFAEDFEYRLNSRRFLR